MTILNQMNLCQNEDGLWYVVSPAAIYITSDVGKLLHLTPYPGKDIVVTGAGSHHPIFHIGSISLSIFTLEASFFLSMISNFPFPMFFLLLMLIHIFVTPEYIT